MPEWLSPLCVISARLKLPFCVTVASLFDEIRPAPLPCLTIATLSLLRPSCVTVATSVSDEPPRKPCSMRAELSSPSCVIVASESSAEELPREPCPICARPLLPSWVTVASLFVAVPPPTPWKMTPPSSRPEPRVKPSLSSPDWSTVARLLSDVPAAPGAPATSPCATTASLRLPLWSTSDVLGPV